MIIHDVEQGSEEWLKLRLGIPTASNFSRIVTSTGKLSKQAKDYAHALVAEMITGQSMERDLSRNEDVIRGKILEPQAVLAYEFEYSVQAAPVGFVTSDDGQVGVSPDRLIGKNGLAEFKCPKANTHIGYILDGFGDDYKCQVQGQLLFTDREWNDRVSYCPEVSGKQLFCERSYRDEDFIKNLDTAIRNFVEMKSEMLEKVKAFQLAGEPA